MRRYPYQRFLQFDLTLLGQLPYSVLHRPYPEEALLKEIQELYDGHGARSRRFLTAEDWQIRLTFLAI
jgi:hypothetical protein